MYVHPPRGGMDRREGSGWGGAMLESAAAHEMEGIVDLMQDAGANHFGGGAAHG